MNLICLNWLWNLNNTWTNLLRLNFNYFRLFSNLNWISLNWLWNLNNAWTNLLGLNFNSFRFFSDLNDLLYLVSLNWLTNAWTNILVSLHVLACSYRIVWVSLDFLGVGFRSSWIGLNLLRGWLWFQVSLYLSRNSWKIK